MQVPATVHSMAEVRVRMRMLMLVIVRSMAVVLERRCAYLVGKG
jgi:hypothetical protein